MVILIIPKQQCLLILIIQVPTSRKQHIFTQTNAAIKLAALVSRLLSVKKKGRAFSINAIHLWIMQGPARHFLTVSWFRGFGLRVSDRDGYGHNCEVSLCELLLLGCEDGCRLLRLSWAYAYQQHCSGPTSHSENLPWNPL